MANIQALSAFFWFHDNIDDPNAPMDNDIITLYRVRATYFAVAFFCFENLLDTLTESEISDLTYRAANFYADKTKTNTKEFWRYFYLLFFGTERGPRVPTFITMYGIKNFYDNLKNKMENPFGF